MDLSLFPLPFFLSLVALVGFSLFAWSHRREGWGLPMGMALGTTAVWYHGDALYNDYERYRSVMSDDALAAGWWQVLLFIVALGLAVPALHRLINERLLGRRSHVLIYMETRRLEHPEVQKRIDHLVMAMLAAWLVLMGVALLRVNFNFMGLFAPYLSEKVNPWGRGRLGGGLDALLSLAGYLQIFLAAGFGVMAALARNPKTRRIAIAVCVLTFPYYIFDRTRNAMLATMLPGLLAWVFMRLDGGLMKKAFVLCAAFLLVNYWFSFVISNRAQGSISRAFRSSDGVEQVKETKHAGISMFSELGYMNGYIEHGTYQPNWGERYFAEVVNVVPRSLWKNKPMIGIDYAVARGFGTHSGNASSAGVTTSIATGMIGQGVVNFGRVLGPVAAALLMSIWVTILARQDLLGNNPARLLLYAVGMILTFNMGRDITLLVLYPYVFGWMLLVARERYERKKNQKSSQEKGSGPSRRAGSAIR